MESQDSEEAVTSNFNRALYVCRIYRFAFEAMFSFHPNIALFDGNSPKYAVAARFFALMAEKIKKKSNLMLSAFYLMEIFIVLYVNYKTVLFILIKLIPVRKCSGLLEISIHFAELSDPPV